MADENCDCIFCNSKCPECGSINIKVNFSVGYEYDNDTEDLILIKNLERYLRIRCKRCGKESEREFNNGMPKLKSLEEALMNYTKLPIDCCINLMPVEDEKVTHTTKIGRGYLKLVDG